MTIQTYLFFNGRCDEAVQFYQRALGARPGPLMRFKDAPDQSTADPASRDKVMHGSLTIGDTEILISDGRNDGNPRFEGFSLTLRPADEAEAERIFSALAEGGEIGMPLASTFFAKKFGMLTDRFGVGWMVIA